VGELDVTVAQLRIPKKQQPISLWIHPEGQILGAVFVQIPTANDAATENPCDVLNNQAPFLVVMRDDLGGPRFYSKRSVVRVEYYGKPPEEAGLTRIGCRLLLMDGSFLEGDIIEGLPSDHSRLFDYLNQEDQRFVRIYAPGERIWMVNKAYVVHLSEASD
jgi:hypothetical protein